jgi:hypothetical protein
MGGTHGRFRPTWNLGLEVDDQRNRLIARSNERIPGSVADFRQRAIKSVLDSHCHVPARLYLLGLLEPPIHRGQFVPIGVTDVRCIEIWLVLDAEARVTFRSASVSEGSGMKMIDVDQ